MLLEMIKAMGSGTGIANFTIPDLIMICFGLLFIWFGIKKNMSPFF